MPHLDVAAAECLIFTFKEGMLASIAHDLKIKATKLALDHDQASVRVRIEATSLRVVCAMAHGAPREGALSDGDKQKIESSIVDDVLEARRYPTIEFSSSSVVPEGDALRITGELALHGHRRTIELLARPEGNKLVGEVTLHQPDFGIKPYSAMLGTLKIRPDVVIRYAVPR